MKKILLPLLLLVCSNFLFAQKTAPFIIQGQLKNFKSKKLVLTLIDLKKGETADTIPVTADGKFYYKTSEIQTPQKAVLSYNAAFFHTNIFVTPGYNLTITADCENLKTAKTSKKITGIGAIVNTYIFKADSIAATIKVQRDWFELKPAEFPEYENARQRSLDSVYKLVFNSKKTSDKYAAYFAKMVRLDNKYERLDRFTLMATRNHDLSTYQQTVDFISKNCGADVFDDLYNEGNLISEPYIIFMRDGYYSYLWSLNCKRSGGAGCSNQSYLTDCVKIMGDNYKGTIRQIALYNFMYTNLLYSRSFEGFNSLKLTFPKYITLLTDKSKQDKLNNLMATKGEELLKTRVNQPAPAFTAVDSAGKLYSNADFKGKVVVFDLWGSWCGPCRTLTPYFKVLVDKYKKENRLVFVSIAVFDEDKKWRVAMEEDKPTWLQLLDNTGSVHTNYVANSVPKFVVINKQGNITTFDAPISKSFTDLEKIITAELDK